MNKDKVQSAFFTLIILFFLWGFLTSLNDILVPHFKKAFDLKNWQAQLVQFAFFGAYFLMAVPAGMVIKKYGYRKGIVIALITMGLGCFVFFPAAEMVNYYLFLIGLFILASGITVLQVAANPYVAVVGPEDTAASRLNLAQGFNSLGHTVAPLFGSFLILQNETQVEVGSVKLPYVGIGIALILIGLVFSKLHLPNISENEEEKRSFSLFKHSHLTFGSLAIFFYVGAEITIGSFMTQYLALDDVMGFNDKTAGAFVALYWGGAMIGRFMGALSMSKNASKGILMLVLPFVAFLIVYFVINQASGISFMQLIGFLVVLVVNYLAFLFGKSLPSRILAVFALCCVALITISILSSSYVAMWSMLGIGMFNSIMWSNIFTLSIKDLGEDTSYGSSLLVMMIVGGAILPPLQGILADLPSIGIKYSYIVPILAYLYIAFFGLKGHKVRV